MKICRHCGRPVPDTLLDCPLCANRRAREHLLTSDARWAQDIAAGHVELKLVSVPRGGKHLEFLTLGGQTYCGHLLASHMRRERVAYEPELERRVCPACWRELQRLIRVTAGAA